MLYSTKWKGNGGVTLNKKNGNKRSYIQENQVEIETLHLRKRTRNGNITFNKKRTGNRGV